MAKKIYKEKQEFNDTLVLAAMALAMVGLLITASSYFWSPNVTAAYSIVCLVLAAGLGYGIWWLKRLELKLKVTKKSIKVEMEGVSSPTQKIAWKNVANCEVVEPSPFNSWNGRHLHLGRENQYSLTGNSGLFVETKDGKQYFIGCRNLDELKLAFRDTFKGSVLNVA